MTPKQHDDVETWWEATEAKKGKGSKAMQKRIRFL